MNRCQMILRLILISTIHLILLINGTSAFGTSYSPSDQDKFVGSNNNQQMSQQRNHPKDSPSKKFQKNAENEDAVSEKSKFQNRNNFWFENPPTNIDRRLHIAKNIGHNFIQMMNEVSQHSDVYHKKDQGYDSVQKLLQAFYKALSKPSNQMNDATSLKAIFDGTEYNRNRAIASNLFESDIVLTVDQLKGIVVAASDANSPLRRRRRKVITGSTYRWSMNYSIPFEFNESDEWKEETKEAIRRGISFWQKETCLRWQEGGRGEDRIKFIRGNGCFSNVGRTGGQQLISIGDGCESMGVITHEIGHALGFWHEQSRTDRDQYIRLMENFIHSGAEGNFVKRSAEESDDMGLPFDFGSVMLYGPNAFSTYYNRATIETLDKRFQRTIGQREHPSYIDIKQANRLYCNNFCEKTENKCKNGGYPNPNDCLQCKCPTGLGGPQCENVQPSECGGELNALDNWQNLSYTGSGKCYWRIKADDKKIRINIAKVSFDCATTCKSFIEIKYDQDFQQTGFRLCCQNNHDEVVSMGNEIIVIFNGRHASTDGEFTLQYIKDDNDKVPPKPTEENWKSGRENRPFRNTKIFGKGGPIERFILNTIPRIRDPDRPILSMASLAVDVTLGQLLGVNIQR